MFLQSFFVGQLIFFNDIKSLIGFLFLKKKKIINDYNWLILTIITN